MAIAYYLRFDGLFSNEDVHQGVSLINVRPLPLMGVNERGKSGPSRREGKGRHCRGMVGCPYGVAL